MPTFLHLGCSLSYRLRGSGPPVLFIQGVGVHGDGWAPQTDQLSAKFQCLSFDNRGMGASQPVGNAPLTIEQFAADAIALMDSQNWFSAHVVGHSMGGLIAQQLALSFPQRVRSLSLLCTISRGRDALGLSPGMMWTGMRTRIGTRRMRRHAFLEIVMPLDLLAREDRDALAAKLEPIFGHDLADTPPIVMKQLGAMGRCDLTPRLGELKGIPTLVVAGSHDRIARPASGRSIANGIPGVRYIEFEEAAHGLPIQCAARVNALLEGHIAQAENARA